MVADPDPRAIAEANENLLKQQLDPYEVRSAVLTQVQAERQQFLDDLNAEWRAFSPGSEPFTSFRPFIETCPWTPPRSSDEGETLARYLSEYAR
jgi:hypothetical protein